MNYNMYNREFEHKDRDRVAAIVRKAAGDRRAELELARRMADKITHADKAWRRAHAATFLNAHAVASVFFVRYGQLTA